MKTRVVRELRWSLYDIDETDINNLMAFIHFKPSDDPNVRVINGKTYHRATKPPSWL
ncbi:hypothetical protein OIN60_01540 [Paenibacillus sp. P96]|uniref:Uncharacterized protein n=1 Tax=Paenibacillus zeirhizosphaerae TaxID=2987519 RepID=A0ABT9FL78_9BACL|nr:hypothetical protein [Paenibacillus sp. P96]MDP4095475.1 hypothetical protein [Paenibacillus sp. P96]